MKKIFVWGIFVLLCAIGMVIAPAPLFAQDPTATPSPALTGTPAPAPVPASDVVTFTQLAFKEKTLRGPFDATNIALNLPADWRVTAGARVELALNVVFSGSGVPLRPGITSSSTAQAGRLFGGSLEIDFNNTTIATVLLEKEGEQVVSVPIPAELFAIPTRSNRHRLQISLDSAVDCDFDWHTTIVVRTTSRFVLPHDLVSPNTDLRLLPRSLYQGTFMPETALIVVPDKPTAGELQAALSISAGLGRMSGGKLGITLVPAGRLTRDAQSTTNLIFVGNANDFAMLDGVALDAPDAQADDGIVQIAISPWNPLRLIIFAGGNNDIAVTKAGQALSTGVIKAGAQPNRAIVSDVRPDLNPAAFATDRTLTALGYQNITLQDFGTNSIEYRFFVPPGQTLTGDAFFDLIFNHSAMLEFEKSGILITLNDEPVGSVRFTEDTAKLGNVRIPIPRTAVRPGNNRLGVTVDLFPRYVCVDPRFSLLWATIRAESLLHLPLAPMQNPDVRVIDLAGYPALFTQHPTLSTTAFVLAPNDPNAWNVAAQIAYDLGYTSGAPLADVGVVFADAVPESVRKTRDWVLIGKPTTLALLNDLRDVLPAPFEPGSDLAVERNVRVVYRIPANASVGYLELMNAPWNNERVILGVLGTDEAGVRAAGAALVTPRLRVQLSGNYAFVNGEQIVNGDSRAGPVITGVAPTAVPGGEVVPPTDAEVPAIVAKPAWILPALGVSVGLMAVVLLIIAISAVVHRPRLK